jgi:hypothetical protein
LHIHDRRLFPAISAENFFVISKTAMSPIFDYQGLLKTQRNELFEIVRNEGFDPTDFKWTTAAGRRGGREYEISVLVYKNSQYFYKFGTQRELFWCERCPGIHMTSDHDDPSVWGHVVTDFADWLKRLKSEIETPDLWVEAERYYSVFHLPVEPYQQDIPFSHSEAQQISAALKQVEKNIINTINPAEDQVEFIRYKLSYLDSAAKKPYSRIDWLNILIGVLTTIAVTLSLSPEQAHTIFMYFRQALGSVIPTLK